ncbi:hypothetical protein RS030_203243 [Cryptosporidium xiaoi]|uniref:C2H2-type domain-containing protein n=1 Tax=Cryptosporidium xiaoi TaxID=659607 RepID=A0AAV9XY09_9CRYT
MNGQKNLTYEWNLPQKFKSNNNSNTTLSGQVDNIEILECVDEMIIENKDDIQINERDSIKAYGHQNKLLTTNETSINSIGFVRSLYINQPISIETIKNMNKLNFEFKNCMKKFGNTSNFLLHVNSCKKKNSCERNSILHKCYEDMDRNYSHVFSDDINKPLNSMNSTYDKNNCSNIFGFEENTFNRDSDIHILFRNNVEDSLKYYPNVSDNYFVNYETENTDKKSELQAIKMLETNQFNCNSEQNKALSDYKYTNSLNKFTNHSDTKIDSTIFNDLAINYSRNDKDIACLKELNGNNIDYTYKTYNDVFDNLITVKNNVSFIDAFSLNKTIEPNCTDILIKTNNNKIVELNSNKFKLSNSDLKSKLNFDNYGNIVMDYIINKTKPEMILENKTDSTNSTFETNNVQTINCLNIPHTKFRSKNFEVKSSQNLNCNFTTEI